MMTVVRLVSQPLVMTVVVLVMSLSSTCVAAFGIHVPSATVLRRSSQSKRIFPSSLSSSSTTSSSSSSSSSLEAIDDNAATLRCMTFCGLTKSQEPQLLCDFLMEIGACSTSITDYDVNTEHEDPIFKEPGNFIMMDNNDDDNVDQKKIDAAAIVCGDHAVGQNVWNRCNVNAHFGASADLQLIMELVEETLDLPLFPSYNITNVPNRDWVVHVQQSWNPILVEGIVLRFPWHTQDHVAKIVADYTGPIVQLQLEGGIAFGTGEHPTTQLCLSWIQDVLRDNGDTIDMLMDYGAGSGVLGLAACALSNSTIKVVGVDIDVDAVRIANTNSVTNGLDMVNYLPPLVETADSESKSVLMKAYQLKQEQVLPPELDGPIYGALVANILAAPLVTLAPTLYALVKPGGYVGLSGILAKQASMVVEAYSKLFVDVKVSKEQGGWVLISMQKKNDDAL